MTHTTAEQMTAHLRTAMRIGWGKLCAVLGQLTTTAILALVVPLMLAPHDAQAKTSAVITLNSSANPVAPNTAVTLSATVTGSTPTGLVTFKDGSVALGSVYLGALIPTHTWAATL